MSYVVLELTSKQVSQALLLLSITVRVLHIVVHIAKNATFCERERRWTLIKIKKILFKKISKLDLSAKKEYNLKDKKVGKDKKLNSKPKSLREFINYAENKEK